LLAARAILYCAATRHAHLIKAAGDAQANAAVRKPTPEPSRRLPLLHRFAGRRD
jgi:hypothetical protein